MAASHQIPVGFTGNQPEQESTVIRRQPCIQFLPEAIS
jgi:hypothetical protein